LKEEEEEEEEEEKRREEEVAVFCNEIIKIYHIFLL